MCQRLLSSRSVYESKTSCEVIMYGSNYFLQIARNYIVLDHDLPRLQELMEFVITKREYPQFGFALLKCQFH